MGMKVYDKVWIMENNKPVKKIVFSVVHSMSHMKNGVDTHYQLVDSQVGAGFGNNEGVRRGPDEVFPSKDALLKSL